MQQKTLFIINARAGKGQIKNHLLYVINQFNARGHTVEVHITQTAKDATRLAAQKGADYDLLLCSGGDGTLNEIVNGLMQNDNKRPLLAYLPAGSTNDFAFNLYDNMNIKKITDSLLDGCSLACDVGRFNQQHYIYCAAFGALIQTSYETAQANKNILGRVAYFLEGTKHLNTLKTYRMTVQYENKTIEDDFIYGMVTNSDSVAGIRGFGGRNVQLDDGLFEVLLVRMPKSLFDLQQIIAGLIKLDFPAGHFYSFKTHAVTFSSAEPISWNLDGEYGGDLTEATIGIENKAISFLIPLDEAESALPR